MINGLERRRLVQRLPMMKLSLMPRSNYGRRRSGQLLVLAHEHFVTNPIHGRWKLHLRPAHLTVATASAIPPLPAGTSVDIIFTDFLRYVKEQVQEYITISHGNGDRIWSVLHRNMTVVLTTPNGWEGAQQQRMRSAATKAGLVNAQGTQHIRFVSEAEVRDYCSSV
jgi:putative component of toxin-antitoxin plasmid stabilization module